MLQQFNEKNRDLMVNINGRLVHRDEAGVSPFDSAVQGGDAVWEGLRLYDGRIFKLNEHLERLRRSATALAFAHRSFGGGEPAVIELCDKFFTLTPVPDANSLTHLQYASMPGVMVHEFAHISVRAIDSEYNCRKGTALSIVPGAALINADNYRCWVEDAAVGWSDRVGLGAPIQ